MPLVGNGWVLMFCFFFQAEDGIRDVAVTGVQTCALPISIHPVRLIKGVPSWWADSRAIATQSRSRAAATCERYAHTARRARQRKTAPSSTARTVNRRAARGGPFGIVSTPPRSVGAMTAAGWGFQR